MSPELEQLYRIAWIGLIPVLVLMVVVLVQLIQLLTSCLELAFVARTEVLPALKDLRLTVGHVEDVTHRLANGAEIVEAGWQQAAPRVQQVARVTRTGLLSLASGLKKSFLG